MLISVTNKSALVSDADAAAMTAAVNDQVRLHAAGPWGIVPPQVEFTTAAPAGTVVIGILDDPDQANALGWHTEAAGGVVYGRVFARPVLDHGGNALTSALSVASVLSHEVLETAFDPACDLWADAGTGTAYAREACDAVESDSYPLTVSGVVMVSNFLLPAWFDPDAAPGSDFDYMGLCTAPFQVRPTGYTITLAEGQVKQVFGESYPQWRTAGKAYPVARTARRLKQGSR